MRSTNPFVLDTRRHRALAWLLAGLVASCSVYGEDLLESGEGGSSSSGKSTSTSASTAGGAGGDGGATASTTSASTTEASTTTQASTTTSTSTGMGGDPSGGGGSGGGPLGNDAWINEIHYDNASADVGEGVEIAGSAGLDLSGWSIVVYNGSSGMVSATGTIALSGTIPNQMNGLGTRWFAIVGLENGAPDGVALVDDNNTVIQFLGYEGTFTATGGPASGLTSVGLPVDEEPGPAAGTSLQLTGAGSTYASFTWAENVPASPDQINPGQTFN
ncbi:MAG: lamin tail domain-containing protein [Myxococcales bacterium]|nr:lamin tail domain-containing protein [Myxococcales bacterium]